MGVCEDYEIVEDCKGCPISPLYPNCPPDFPCPGKICLKCRKFVDYPKCRLGSKCKVARELGVEG